MQNTDHDPAASRRSHTLSSSERPVRMSVATDPTSEGGGDGSSGRDARERAGELECVASSGVQGTRDPIRRCATCCCCLIASETVRGRAPCPVSAWRSRAPLPPDSYRSRCSFEAAFSCSYLSTCWRASTRLDLDLCRAASTSSWRESMELNGGGPPASSSRLCLSASLAVRLLAESVGTGVCTISGGRCCRGGGGCCGCCRVDCCSIRSGRAGELGRPQLDIRLQNPSFLTQSSSFLMQKPRF